MNQPATGGMLPVPEGQFTPHSRQMPARGLFRALVPLVGLLLLLAAFVDYAATHQLAQIPAGRLVEFMKRSVFDGHPPGANDLVITYLLAVAVIYGLLHFNKKPPWLRASWRPEAGFVLTAALVVSLFMVHGLKYTVGRARPSAVFSGEQPFTVWFQPGPHLLSNGHFDAAFPSGHTALTFILMTMAYVLAADSHRPRQLRRIGWLVGGLALGLSLLMGVMRCVTAHHWLTDILASIGLGWLVMHWVYFNLLCIPKQRQYWLVHGKGPNLPPAWELRLCVYILMTVTGLMGIVIALREIFYGSHPLWALLLLPGMAGLIIGWYQSGALQARLRLECQLTRPLGYPP